MATRREEQVSNQVSNSFKKFRTQENFTCGNLDSFKSAVKAWFSSSFLQDKIIEECK
jgi:hypothetical protein